MSNSNTAGQATNAGPIGYGSTLGTTSGPALGPNATRTALWVYNPSASATIAICPALVGVGPVLGGNPSPAWPLAAGVAAINGAGSITLNPGDKMLIDNVNVTGAFNGIASAANTPATFWES